MYRRIYQRGTTDTNSLPSIMFKARSFSSKTEEKNVVFTEAEEEKLSKISAYSCSELSEDETERYLLWITQKLRHRGKEGEQGRSLMAFIKPILYMTYDRDCGKLGDTLVKVGALDQLMGVARQQFCELGWEKLDTELCVTTLGVMGNCSDSSVPFIKAVLPWTKYNHKEYRALAVLTLAYIVDEEDNDKLMDDTDTIGNCVHWLKSAVKRDDDRRRMGFSAWELTLGLAKLAVNDANKIKIVKEGALAAFLNILQHTDVKEQAAAAESLWTLCFDDQVRQQISDYPELVPALEKLENSEDKEVKKNVRGALWVIRGKNEASVHSDNSKKENHIFISYSWSEKELVKKIHKNLVSVGHKVWVDWEQMGGSTLQAMAEAVENSAIVLICMSEKYKQSPNCRTEAEYTFQQRKEYIPLLMQRSYKPDGWLGALLGAKLFFDFSGKYPFEKTWGGLIRELKGKISGATMNIDSTDSQPVVSSTKANCLSMSKSDVHDFLMSHDLESIPSGLKEFDGKLLWQLKKLRDVDPQFFHKTLDRKYDMTLPDILRLNSALDELH